jgi:hypothetical protein
MARDPKLDPSGLARAAERLSAAIPTYSGYRHRDRFREEDRMLREAVSQHLALIVGRLERAIGSGGTALAASDREGLQRAVRALNRQRDRIRFAPAGYSSLFSRRRIPGDDLDDLRALDGGVWALLEGLDRQAGSWDEQARRGRIEGTAEPVEGAVMELEDLLDRRESLLRS